MPDRRRKPGDRRRMMSVKNSRPSTWKGAVSCIALSFFFPFSLFAGQSQAPAESPAIFQQIDALVSAELAKDNIASVTVAGISLCSLPCPTSYLYADHTTT